MNKINYIGYSESDIKIFKNRLGRKTVSNDELNYLEYDNAILQPFLRIKPKPNTIQRFKGGLFTKEGKSIKESFLKRQNKIVAGSNAIDLSQTSQKYANNDFDYIYIGFVENQYGHFLVEAVTKIFVLEKRQQDLKKVKLVFSGMKYLPDFIIDLFALFGLTEDNFLIVNEQAYFKKIIVPKPPYIIKQSINSNLFHSLHKLVKRNIDFDQDQNEIPAFISRANFNKVVSEVIGEQVLQEILSKNGYKVYHPEEMSILDQIKMVNRHKNYLGFSGSALHNFIFSIKPINLIQYSSRGFPKVNFVLLDTCNPSVKSSHYINSTFANNKLGDFKFNLFKRAQVIDVPKILEHLNSLNFLPKIEFSKKELESKLIKEYENYGIQYSSFKNENNKMKNRVFSKWGNTEILNPDSFGKVNYLKVLNKLHQYFSKDYIYFEIGTNKGNSMKFSKGHCIGVDPNFIVEQNIINSKQSLQLYQVPSDDFFDNHALSTFQEKKIDMAFIDGLHHSDQVFMDFINTEQYSKQNTVFLFHDILPKTYETALKKRETNMWTGDVWKAIWVLYKQRDDLDFIFIDAPPSGLLLVQYKSKQANHSISAQLKLLNEVKSIKDDTIYEYLEAIEVVSTNDVIKYVNDFDSIPRNSDLKKRKLAVKIKAVSNHI